jgi:hypothetical protein
MNTVAVSFRIAWIVVEIILYMCGQVCMIIHSGINNIYMHRLRIHIAQGCKLVGSIITVQW